MDHFAGFDRLLRRLLGREKTVSLYGPAGFIDNVGHKLNAYTWNLVRSYTGNLVFELREVHDDGTVCAISGTGRASARNHAVDPARCRRAGIVWRDHCALGGV